MYYLKSHYYDPGIRRFISSDTVMSNSINGKNLFAYCENNPVNMADYDGHAATELLIGGLCFVGAALLGMIVNSEPVKRTSQSFANVVVGGVRSLAEVTYNTFSAIFDKKIGFIENEKSISIPKSPRNQAYFPENPFDFHPIGLIPSIRIPVGNGKNGGIIHWRLPGTQIAIFEWDEDYRYGSHYHVMLKEHKNKHLNGMHYLPGMPVPEPWNSMYFG